MTRRVLAATTALVGLFAITAAPAAAGPAAPVVHLTLAVHADQLEATPVDTALRVDAPLDWPNVKDLLAERSGTVKYHAALCGLLASLGVLQQKELPVALGNDVDRLPRITTGGGRVTVQFSGTRDLATDLVAAYTFYSGIWRAKRSGDVVTFWVPSSRKIPAGVVWHIDAYLAGADIRSTLPPPGQRNRVDGFPSVGQSPKVLPDGEQGGTEHVGWVLPGDSSTAYPAVCTNKPAIGSTGRLVTLAASVARSTRILVTSYTGLRAHIRLALLYLSATIFFLPLVGFGYRCLRRPGRRSTGQLVWIGLTVWLATLGAGVASWLTDIRSVSVNIDQVRPELIAGGVVCALTALVVTGRARLALALLAIGVAVAGWFQGDALRQAYPHPGSRPLTEASVSAVAVASTFLASLAALTWLLLRSGRSARPTWLPRPRLLALAVVAVAVLLVAQTGSAAYRSWETHHAIGLALNPSQGLIPGAVPDDWRIWVLGPLFVFPLSFIALIADLLPLLGFVIALSLLVCYAQSAKSTFFESGQKSARLLVMLLFAAFVVGTTGSYYGWRMPLAFVLALALWAILPRRKLERVAGGSGGGMQVMQLRANRFERAATLVRAQAAAGGKGSIPVLERAMALNLGPGGTWLENGCIAARLGAWLATVPVGFFVYVLLTHRIHDFSPWNSTGGVDVVRSVVQELVFWLAASFALGALFAELPGWRGAIKGGVLGVFYLAAVGLSVWILPGRGGDWFFRAFELFVFLLVLGIALDWETLRRFKVPWTYLLEYYRVADLRFGATYVSSLAGVLIVIVQQLQSGQASQAVTQIIKSAPALIPPPHM